jgi:myo-inositol-1-phosphate synthase
MHTVLGGYHIGIIEIVAAFDIDKKVGKDLPSAPNPTIPTGLRTSPRPQALTS